MLSLSELSAEIRKGMAPIIERFEVSDRTLDVVASAPLAAAGKPGVYIFWKEGIGVIKIGKHQSNARVRALEHVRAPTKNERFDMSTLANDPQCHLVLYTLGNANDLHWLLSLEAFCEWNLSPLIPSRRTG